MLDFLKLWKKLSSLRPSDGSPVGSPKELTSTRNKVRMMDPEGLQALKFTEVIGDRL